MIDLYYLFGPRQENYKCPFCGGFMPTEQYKWGRPWVCPSCSAELKTSSRREQIIGCGSLACGALLAYLFGVRGVWIVLLTLVLWLPVTFVWIGVSDRLFPPKLVRYDEWDSPWRSPNALITLDLKEGDNEKEPPRT